MGWGVVGSQTTFQSFSFITRLRVHGLGLQEKQEQRKAEKDAKKAEREAKEKAEKGAKKVEKESKGKEKESKEKESKEKESKEKMLSPKKRPAAADPVTPTPSPSKKRKPSAPYENTGQLGIVNGQKLMIQITENDNEAIVKLKLGTGQICQCTFNAGGGKAGALHAMNNIARKLLQDELKLADLANKQIRAGLLKDAIQEYTSLV